MALESVVFQQDPTFMMSCKDPWPGCSLPRNYVVGDPDRRDWECYASPNVRRNGCDDPKDYWPPGEVSTNSSASSENGSGEMGFPSAAAAAVTTGRRKRRRARAVKKQEVVEIQRMTHIAVERNRRRQMNDYLTVLRSMMPPSYARRGDQASIVGGAINFVKELEQLHQYLEARRQKGRSSSALQHPTSIFSDFFTFPQYSTGATGRHSGGGGSNSPAAASADVEVTVVDGHANIKVRSKRQPAQLLKMVVGLHSLRLYVLHMTLTVADAVVLFSFSVKVEESCQLNSANEIATAVYEIVSRIQDED